MPPFKPTAIPASNFVSTSEKVRSGVAIDAGCEDYANDSILCRFWQENVSWDTGFVDYRLPCSYLVYDVCEGTYAC